MVTLPAPEIVLLSVVSTERESINSVPEATVTAPVPNEPLLVPLPTLRIPLVTVVAPW